MLGYSVVCWKSRKQNCVVLSTCEAEYIALTEVCKEVIWIRRILEELDTEIELPTVIHEDNQGTLEWGTEGVRNAKRIGIKVNYVKEQVGRQRLCYSIVPLAKC